MLIRIRETFGAAGYQDRRAAFVETGYGRQCREVLAPEAERRTNCIGQQSLQTFRPDLMRERNRRRINS